MLFWFSLQIVIAQEVNTREVSVVSDNDAYLFINQDQYYTNGIAFRYRQLGNTKYLKPSLAKTMWELSIGHKLYNASSGSTELALMDRPFTAYLYINAKNAWFYKNESVLSLAVETGLYGKAAFGEALQKGFHQLLGFYEISGWEYQLQSHAVLDFRAHYSRFLTRSSSQKFDLQLLSKASAGLNQNYIGVGPAFRVGQMNTLDASAFYGARLSASSDEVKRERYFYYKPMLFYRLYDASIQGGLLLNERGPVTFGIKPWMLSQVVGFSYAKKPLSMDFHLQFNTKEVKSFATAHQYGSMSLGYTF